MKNTTLLIALVFVTTIGLAQEQEYRTLFSSNNNQTHVSGFGTVTLDFGQAENEFAFYMGGEGAVLLNRSFYLGFYGKGLTTLPTYYYNEYSPILNTNISRTKSAVFGHGGLMIGYIIHPEKPLHFGISSKFGAGAMGLIDEYNYNNPPNQNGEYLSTGPLFIITPQIDLEMNITNWFKFRVAASAQYVATNKTITHNSLINGQEVEQETLNTSNYSTGFISMGLVFGWFK